MEGEPLQRLIERSIENNIIDGHAIDQDGSNVLIVGDEIHYCSDEGARAFLTSRAERPVAAGQSEGEPPRKDSPQHTDEPGGARRPTTGNAPQTTDERAAPTDGRPAAADGRSVPGDDRRPVESESRGTPNRDDAEASLGSTFGRRPAAGATA